jgi:hypothetical protein
LEMSSESTTGVEPDATATTTTAATATIRKRAAVALTLRFTDATGFKEPYIGDDVPSSSTMESGGVELVKRICTT